MTGTWKTSSVDIANPPNPTAIVNSRGAVVATVDASTWPTDDLAAVSVGAVDGRAAAAPKNATPVNAARIRMAARHPNADCNQSAPGRKIADASAPQMVSTAIARAGSSGFRRTAVVMVTW